MPAQDFFANEQSLTLPEATTARIELHAADGSTTTLKDGLELQAGEILDATFMSAKALRSFLAAEIKATMTILMLMNFIIESQKSTQKLVSRQFIEL